MWDTEGHALAFTGCCAKVRWFLTGGGEHCYKQLPVTCFSALPTAPQMRSLGRC